MARRSSNTSKGRSLRQARRAARPAEDQQIKAAEALLRNLKTAQAVKDRGARDYHAAAARLDEMELFDNCRRAVSDRRRVTQAYIEAFAVTVAWRFLNESMADGRFMAADGTLLVGDYLAARAEIVQTYLEHRFQPATSTATAHMIEAAVYCAGRRAGNYQITAMLAVTKAEHDAHGFSQLKWSDEPEEVVRAELQRRKNEADKARLEAQRRADGRPTKAERSAVSVKALAEHFGVVTKTIRNWASLGELSGKLDSFPPASLYKELRELSVKLEAHAKAGRASSPTPPEPEGAAVVLPVVIQEPAMRDDRPIGDMPAHEFVATVVNGTTQAILGELERQREADKVAARQAEEQRLAEIVARQTQKRQSVRERAHAMVGAYLDDEMGAAGRLSLDLFDCGVDGNDIAPILKARAFEVGEAYDPADAERALALLDDGMAPRDVGIALRPASAVLQ